MIARSTHLFITAVLTGMFPGAWAAVPPVSSEFQQVLGSWFGALRSGNTTAIAALLGPEELSRSKPQLTNASYGQFLRDRYQNATFTIAGYGSQADGTTFVDVDIVLDTLETERERYVFEASSGKPPRIRRRVSLP
jgi:hypothetical protein